jgi:hypothetical protein
LLGFPERKTARQIVFGQVGFWYLAFGHSRLRQAARRVVKLFKARTFE